MSVLSEPAMLASPNGTAMGQQQLLLLYVDTPLPDFLLNLRSCTSWASGFVRCFWYLQLLRVHYAACSGSQLALSKLLAS